MKRYIRLIKEETLMELFNLIFNMKERVRGCGKHFHHCSSFNYKMQQQPRRRRGGSEKFLISLMDFIMNLQLTMCER